MKTTEQQFNGPTHHVRRDDAVWHHGRQVVPTRQETQWVDSWESFTKAGGITHFNEDQTELVLTLPEGFKFSCQFQTNPLNQPLR